MCDFRTLHHGPSLFLPVVWTFGWLGANTLHMPAAYGTALPRKITEACLPPFTAQPAAIGCWVHTASSVFVGRGAGVRSHWFPAGPAFHYGD